MAMYATHKWWFIFFMLPCWAAWLFLPPRKKAPSKGPWIVERPFRTSQKGESWWVAQAGDKVRIKTSKYRLNPNLLYTVSRTLFLNGLDRVVFLEDTADVSWWLDVNEFEIVTMVRPVTEEEFDRAATIPKHEDLVNFINGNKA